jgi:hypothetical protein
MNEPVRRAFCRGVVIGAAFALGFVFGAHKYHCEYYVPGWLNPRVDKRPGGDFEPIDAWKRREARNAAYYDEVKRKMKEYE